MAVVLPIITTFNGTGLAKAKKEFAQLEGVGAKTGFILKKAMLPLGVAVGAVGAAAVQAGQALLGMAQAAAEDQAAQVALARTLKTAIGATNTQVASVERYIDATQRATGIADDQLRPAFARLVRSTRDAEKAQRILNLALDVSAVTGKPLEAVVNALGRAYDGQNTAVARLGLGIDKTTLKGLDFESLQKRLEKQFKGGSAAAADTFQGRMARLQIRFDEFQEQIGEAVLPLLERLADVAIMVADAFAEQGLGGAMRKLNQEAPKFYEFLRFTYNGFAAVGDAVYNTIKLVQAFKDLALARKPDLSFGYFMPKWEDLMKSTFGMTGGGSRGGSAIAPTVGGVPGLALPEGGVVVPGAGVAGPQGGPGSNRVMPQQVNVTVTSADPKAVVDALQRYNRQNGAIPVTVK